MNVEPLIDEGSEGSAETPFGVSCAHAREILAFLDGLEPDVVGPLPNGLAAMADRLEAVIAEP